MGRVHLRSDGWVAKKLVVSELNDQKWFAYTVRIKSLHSGVAFVGLKFRNQTLHCFFIADLEVSFLGSYVQWKVKRQLVRLAMREFCQDLILEEAIWSRSDVRESHVQIMCNRDDISLANVESADVSFEMPSWRIAVAVYRHDPE